MSDTALSAAHVEAAKELTLQVVNKGLLTFIREDHDYPEKLAAKIGTLYAGFYDAVSNHESYLKK